MEGMKVFFMAASRSFGGNLDVYNKIFNVIKETGNRLILKTDPISYKESIGGGDVSFDNEDWKILCKREVDAAQMCDVAIFDATNKASFGVGYLAALTLAAGKPCLLLLHKDSLGGSIITGLEHPMLTREYFDEDNIGKIVEQFLKQGKRLI
jgi:hypothetical protein